MLNTDINKNKRLSNMAFNYAIFLLLSCVLSFAIILSNFEGNVFSTYLGVFVRLSAAIFVFAYFRDDGVFKYEEIILFIIFLVWFLFVTLIHFTGFVYFAETVISVTNFMIFSKIFLKQKSVGALKLMLFLFSAVVLYIFFIVEVDIKKINPNTIGRITFSLAAVSLISYKVTKKYRHMVLFILNVIFLILSKSRASLLSLVLFVLLLLFKIKFSRKRIFVVFLLLNFAAIVFAYFYAVVFFDNNRDLLILGKRLYSGREKIWQAAFRELAKSYNWIIGLGNRLDVFQEGNVDATADLHNQMMGFLTIFGVPALIMAIVMFSTIFSRSENKYCVSSSLKLVFVIFIMCFFEVIMFSPFSFSFFIITFLLVKSIENIPKVSKTKGFK